MNSYDSYHVILHQKAEIEGKFARVCIHLFEANVPQKYQALLKKGPWGPLQPSIYLVILAVVFHVLCSNSASTMQKPWVRVFLRSAYVKSFLRD